MSPQSEDARGYNGRGDSWWRKKAYDKAIADFSEAIRFKPEDPIAYNNGAGSKGRRAQTPDIVTAESGVWIRPRKHARSPNGREALLLDTLAAAYAEAGDFDAAVKWQLRANALDSNAGDKAKGLGG